MAPALRWIALGGIVAMSAACAPWHFRPCLGSSDPRTAETRKGWAEAGDESIPWAKRVCAVESVASHFQDYTDRVDEPQCRAELAYELSNQIFSSDPIRFDRVQIGRVVAVSRLWDTTDVMPQKAEILIRLADLTDDEIQDYRMAPGETGAPPPKGWLRRLALSSLARSNLFLNVEAAKKYELSRRAHAEDDVDRRILYWILAQELENALWGHPKVAVDNGSFALFDRMIREVEATLSRPFDALSFDLLVDHLLLAGTYARRFGRAAETERLLASILDRKADVPACAGHPAARRDLYVTATLARFDARSVLEHVGPNDYERPLAEQAPIDWLSQIIEAPLYEHGVDCRGKGAADLFLPGLLDRVEEGSLKADDTSDPDAKALLLYLSERPAAIATRSAARRFIFRYIEERIRKAPATLVDEDFKPLVYAFTAALASAPEERPLADRALRAMLEELKTSLSDKLVLLPHRYREIHLLGRYARPFGLTDEAAAIIARLLASPKSSPDAARGYARAVAAAQAALEIAGATG